jgi:hypothetical protein
VVLLVSGGTAAADDLMDHRWPSLPVGQLPKVEDVMLEHVNDYGNEVGDKLDTLSHDVVALHFDARAQRARLRFGGGNTHYLSLRLDSDWLFTDGKAKIHASVQLAVAGHEVDFKLPEMDLSEDSYRGEQMMTVNVPLLEKRF